MKENENQSSGKTLYEIVKERFYMKTIPLDIVLNRENFIFASKEDFEKFIDEVCVKEK